MEYQSILPKIAFEILREIEYNNCNNKNLPPEILTQLHSLFGHTFMMAAELLEKCQITKFQTQDGCREFYKLAANNDGFIIYKDINYCRCQTFRVQVLERKCLTCKHVLAVKLKQITNPESIRVENITDSQLVNFLNEQVNVIDEL